MALLQGGSTVSLWLLGAPPLKGKLWNRIAPLPRPLPHCPRRLAAPAGLGTGATSRRASVAAGGARGPGPGREGGRVAHWQLRRGSRRRTVAVRGLGDGHPAAGAGSAGSRQSLPGAAGSGQHMEERRGVRGGAGPGCGATGTSRRGGGGTGREGGREGARPKGERDGAAKTARLGGLRPEPIARGARAAGAEAGRGEGSGAGAPSGARRRSGRGGAAARLTMSTLAAFSSWAITSGAPPAAAAAAAIMVSLQ